MNKSGGRLLAATLAFAAAGSVQAEVVISQIYGGGGSGAGATYKSDFIELHNNGDTAVDLSGWSVQYNFAPSSAAWQRTALSGSIAAGAYYLIKLGDGTLPAPALPTPDLIGTTQMLTTGGKVLLLDHNTTVSGACPSPRRDLVGISTSANCYETKAIPSTLYVATGAMRKDGGCNDSDNNSTDFELVTPIARNSASPVKLCSNGLPILTVQDLALEEGDSDFSTATVLVKLDRPAGAGGVSFQYTTRDGTATAGSDYVAQTNGSATIAAGQTQVGLTVQIIGDTTPEPHETLFVDLSNIVGAVGSDVSGQITINNDEFVITPINVVQGSGDSSPLNGQLVNVKGVVTGRTLDGFFVQTHDASDDNNPATSEGIFVAAGPTTPGNPAIGDIVRVSGTVTEFVSVTDLWQAPVTQISGAPIFVKIGTASALPQPVLDTAAFTSGQLERYEGMRVMVNSMRASGPLLGRVDEVVATAVNNGVFHGRIDLNSRPFREPGYRLGDPVPTGSATPAIPQWDFNPEVFAVDTDALGYPALDNVGSGTLVRTIKGILDYRARRYTVLLDPETMPDFQRIEVESPPQPRAATQTDTADGPGVSIATYPALRFFDRFDDPQIEDIVLPGSAVQQRLGKASLGVRDYLKLPDIVGFTDFENLATLQALATRINSDAVAAGLPDPQYTAHLLEGNDALGLDPGYLVKSAEVLPGKPRVEVLQVAQIGKDTRWVEPSGNSSLLNDRPPLVLSAVVHFEDGRDFPLNAVLVNQASADGIVPNDFDGQRLRLKRQRQAEFLAGYVNQRQIDSPDARLIVLGDFNAPQFNDGYADVVNVVAGTPSVDDATSVPGDGADLVQPNLIDLTGIAAADERYTSIDRGNAQSLDHVLVNEATVAATTSIELSHARINADFPEINRNNANSALRLSDRDPSVVYLVPPPRTDLGVSALATPGFVTSNENYRFQVSVDNLGPGRAHGVGVGFALDAVLPVPTEPADPGSETPSYLKHVTPLDPNWTCDNSQVVDGKTTVACSTPTLPANASARFEVSGAADLVPDFVNKGIQLAVSVHTQSEDVRTSNDSAQAWVGHAEESGSRETSDK